MIGPVVASGGRLTGVDLSEEMLRQARARAGALGATRHSRFLAASADRLPFVDGVFDAVVAMGLLEYVPDDVAVLREMRRVVRPRGIVVVTVPNLLSPWRLLPILAKPPFLRFLRPAYRALRGWMGGGRGLELDRFPRRLYTPWGLHARLRRAGLRVVDGVFYNFRLPVIGTVCPRVAVGLARALANLGRSPVLGWLAGGYIVLARRPAIGLKNLGGKGSSAHRLT